MSDQDVRLALDDMERMLQEGALTAGNLKPWQERFDAAMASAERGPGWAEIAERAHFLGRRVDLALAGVLADRDAIRKEMRLMAVGGRALKGYKPARC
jgi:hypothetical protein